MKYSILIITMLVSHFVVGQTTKYVSSIYPSDGIEFFDDFALAIQAAQSGDTLMIHSGNWSRGQTSPFILDKSLTIIGPGYDHVINDLRVNTVFQGANIGSIWVEGQVSIVLIGLEIIGLGGQYLSHLFVHRCKIGSLYLKHINYGEIINNYIIMSQWVTSPTTLSSRINSSSNWDALYISSCNYIYISNNLIGTYGGSDILYINGAGSAEIAYNTILSPSSNSIRIYSDVYAHDNITANYETSITTLNQLFQGVSLRNTHVSPGTGLHQIDSVFVALGTVSSTLVDSSFMIRPTSSLVSACQNGTECGAFGGTSPYILSGIPSRPFIQRLLSNRNGSSQGGIDVELKISAQ